MPWGLNVPELLHDGGWGVVVVMVLLISFGLLVPRSVVSRLVRAAEEREAIYKKMAQTAEARGDRVDRQYEQIIPVVKTVEELSRAVQDALRELS